MSLLCFALSVISSGTSTVPASWGENEERAETADKREEEEEESKPTARLDEGIWRSVFGRLLFVLLHPLERTGRTIGTLEQASMSPPFPSASGVGDSSSSFATSRRLEDLLHAPSEEDRDGRLGEPDASKKQKKRK